MKAFIVIIVCLVLALGIYLLIRNYYVYIFEDWLNDRSCTICQMYLESCDRFTSREIEEHKVLVEVWESIMDIPYEKFLFSFKPLKPEYWLTEKQLDFLKINTF